MTFKFKLSIIRHWVPLAIDLEGLRITPLENRLSYLREIFKEKPPNYYKQLLVDFWGMMVQNTIQFQGIGYSKKIQDIKAMDDKGGSNSYQHNLSKKFVTKKKGIRFENYFSVDYPGEEKLDIGLKDNFKNYNKKSPLVRLMIELDKWNTSSLDEFPKELSTYLDDKDSFDFPGWLQKLEEQFEKIHNELKT